MKVGARVQILRKGKVLATGTILRRVNANDDMDWGHKMRPDWITTIDLDGMGPRRFRNDCGTAKDTRRWGHVGFAIEPPK